jgi:uncharacterized tellurite resistance protein B-like protein
MRSYQPDSPDAAGRILALTMIVDGKLAVSEIAAMDSSKILDHIDLDLPGFQRMLQELCDDLLSSRPAEAIELDDALLDRVLAEIAHPDLRRHLLQAMWHIADADDWLADAETVLLTRASTAWSAERNFVGANGRLA